MKPVRAEEEPTDIQGHSVYLAQASDLPKTPEFVGREDEMRLCRIAWGLDKNYRFQDGPGPNYLAFRLYGDPGMGKNELVYELVRRIRANNPTFKSLPFYSMVGHDEMSPEDMVLVVVPTESGRGSHVRMVLRASPLATAIHKGGIFFFDELNRLPERALAPLAPALDGRGMLFSASSGVWLKPAVDAMPFRFCCALNPSAGADLPAYIDQRTLPRIEIAYPGHDGLIAFLRAHLKSDQRETAEQTDTDSEDLDRQLAVLRERLEQSNAKPSVRQGLMVVRLARAMARDGHAESRFPQTLETAFTHVFSKGDSASNGEPGASTRGH